MDKFYIEIAGIVVEVNSQFAFLKKICKDFIVEGTKEVDIVAAATEDDRKSEKSFEGEEFTESVYESIAVYRKVGERLPYHNAFVMHGASVAYRGKGYIFTAPSGTGKSTHIKLWMDNLGEQVTVVNGDKPVLRRTDDGFEVCGTPWAGKEGWKNNIKVPVGGICFITRGKENKIKRINPQDAFLRMIHQIYLTRDPAAKDKTFELLDKLLLEIPLYLLECDMSKEAFATSFEAMTGEKI